MKILQNFKCKLLCLFKPEDANLPRNMSISCKLRVRNVLQHKPNLSNLNKNKNISCDISLYLKIHFQDQTFSAITYTLLILSINNVENQRIHPAERTKETRAFGAKTIRVDSTLETTPPTLFLDPDSRSGSKHFMYYLN